MAGTRCAFPPDTATLEEYCEEWARWAAGLEKIRAQRTNQAELSAFQDDMDAIQAEIRRLQHILQQRIRDHEAATEKRWELHRARLEAHLRNLPPTDMLRLLREASSGGEDSGRRDQELLSMSSDGLGRPITPQVPRADVQGAALDSLAAAALLYHDNTAEAAGSYHHLRRSGPSIDKPVSYSFFEEPSDVSEGACDTATCSSLSTGTGSRSGHRGSHGGPEPAMDCRDPDLATPNGIKQETQQTPAGETAAYGGIPGAHGQTPLLSNQQKQADRQDSPAQKSSPTLYFFAGELQGPAYDRDRDQREVW
ncbi:hypothetical protein HD806DRAFT_551739 [Xylariaceae sp. AK1471]|nr:hypothetical protein HD806DRAFT_551554 [Xylariaceae sp. AK1471]KAI3326662.1 hypothetical protein HD806DRAFT_551739 [Xylariaceae sp. AK1471]